MQGTYMLPFGVPYKWSGSVSTIQKLTMADEICNKTKTLILEVQCYELENNAFIELFYMKKTIIDT